MRVASRPPGTGAPAKAPVATRRSDVDARSTRNTAFPVVAAFCLSGASGLIFEVVWLYRCGLLLGNTVWATSLVLSSFMGGLAIGSTLTARYASHVQRPLRCYASAELVVAAAGLGLTLILGSLSSNFAPLTASFLDRRWLVNLTRLGATFVLLLVPTTAMGTTLPLVTAALRRSNRSFGAVLGWLYGMNTLGAVAGVLALELLLIRHVGILGSAWVAGGFSVTAALIAHWADRWVPATQPDTRTTASPPLLRPVLPLLCALMMGSTLMALEVVWFRFLSMFTVASTLAASLMLAVVLAAIAVGGLVGAIRPDSDPRRIRDLPLVLYAAACTTVVSYGAFQFLMGKTWAAEWPRILWAATVLTGPTAVMSGAGFVMLGSALKQRSNAGDTTTTGWLVAVNTTGGLLGPLVAAFVLLPRLGMEQSLFVLALVYVAAGGIATVESFLQRPRTLARLTVIVGGAALVSIAWFPFGLMARTYFERATSAYTTDGSTVVASRQGPSETIHLLVKRWLDRPLYFRLVTNGFSMSGTHVSGKRYMRYFAYLPMLLHENPLRRALVVCYGAGVTTDAVASIDSVQSIDVVEISPDIAAISPAIYGRDHDPLRDQRVRLHIEDGRYFLQATRDRFDLITGEPPPPLTPGTVSLYTTEYFRLIHDRLSEGGIASYWLPVARRGEYDVKSIISAFCSVFEDCSLWNGTLFDWMLVGTHGLAGPVSEKAFSAPWSDPQVMPRLREVGFEVPEQIGATFLADSDELQRIVAGTKPLSDDFPQRLLPAPWRLSVGGTASDEDRAAAAFMASIVDPKSARQKFEGSRFIRRLWPARLARETLPFFEVQQLVNDVMRDGSDPLTHIGDIHRLLTQTALRRAPLWLLGSDDAQQQAADAETDTSGMSDYVIGIRALVARQYESAAASFANAEHRGLHLRTLRPLLAYALCLSGHMDAARQVELVTTPEREDERSFWNWLRRTFDFPLDSGESRIHSAKR